MINLSERGTQASSPLYENSADSPRTTLDMLNDRIQAQFQRALDNASDYSVSLGYEGLAAYATQNPISGPLCLRPYEVQLILNDTFERVSLGRVIPFSGSADDLNEIVNSNMNSEFTQVFSILYSDLSNRIYDRDNSGCIIC